MQFFDLWFLFRQRVIKRTGNGFKRSSNISSQLWLYEHYRQDRQWLSKSETAKKSVCRNLEVPRRKEQNFQDLLDTAIDKIKYNHNQDKDNARAPEKD